VRTFARFGRSVRPGQRGGETVETFRRGLLGLAAAVGLFVACRGLGQAAQTAQAAPMGIGEESPPAPLCDSWHRGSGEVQAIDLEKIREGYARVKERLSGTLRRGSEREVGNSGAPGYDLGLPACCGPAARHFGPSREIPAELLGKTLWFFTADEEKELRVPGIVSRDPGVVAFLVRTPGLGALGRLSKTLSRPVDLAPRGLAEALGVRCAPALVSISKDAEVDIHENP